MVDDYVTDRSIVDFLSNYFQGKSDLATHVKDEAARETGLRVKIKVFIEAEKWLKSVSIESPRLTFGSMILIIAAT